MRLPLQHAPPREAPPRSQCEHLARLARAAVGLPLGPAAAMLSSARSRGRHGNALQWHLGLDGHDARAEPDWEGRIEVKLVTVWRSGGAIVCDKLKVCDTHVDPWRKLANVLFVFADRLTRTVVGHRFFHLEGAAWAELERAWHVDAHFDGPALFVEARETARGAAPAYYVGAAWLAAHVLPGECPGVFESPRRPAHSGEPVLTVVDGSGEAACPRCGAPMRYDPATLQSRGCAPAHHGLPLPAGCGGREHVAVAAAALLAPAAGSPEDARAGVQGLVGAERVVRLAELVAEPDDHGH